MKKLKKLSLVGRSKVVLHPKELSKINGGGCGCCLCTPEVSASGAVDYTASHSGSGGYV